jgi:hypothetical protein
MGFALATTDREWSTALVESFPRTWQARILSAWRRKHPTDRYGANIRLREQVHKLTDAGRGGIRPDAGDASICEQATTTANDMIDRLNRHKARAGSITDRALVRLQCFYLRNLLRARGMLDLWPDPKRTTRQGAVLRMQCPRFWRRVLRKLHARTVEACAISIGLVRKTAGLYASDESVTRRAGQNARNAAALESVHAVNDHGQDYTLAELAAKGTGNKAIRRVELLTRIAGFEHIAKACGHVGYMVTMTCPSRFHPATTRADGRIFDNPKHDGSTPQDGQRYLSGQWAQCRAAANRKGLDWYGFRIAEPQHDGTPHWHCLLFVRPGQEATLQKLVARYFLDNESPNEPGAQKHRIDFELIDWAKGSAVGYVIKYVSKNIDGHGVGLDLFGNDAITSSQRVEAWASTWRIRQFQQIGGAPVGVWRELRRVHPDNITDDAPDSLRAALSAMNVGKIEPGVQALAWAKYTDAQGGIGTKRADLKIQIEKEEVTGECGRYMEPMIARSIGVRACGWQGFRSHIHDMNPAAPLLRRRLTESVESERAEWVIQQGSREQAVAAASMVFQRSGAAASTRIHVNNCTDHEEIAPTLATLDRQHLECSRPMFEPRTSYRRKLRQFRHWTASSAPPESLENASIQPLGHRQSH